MTATHTTTLTHRLISPVEMDVEGPEDLQVWRDEHSMPWPGREFMPRYQRNEWDGVYRPGRWCVQQGDRFVLRCSRGLHGKLGEAFGPLDGMTSDPRWLALATQYAGKHPRWEELRDYQREAFFQCVRNGWGRIAFATNAGKGAVMALLADLFVRHGQHVLILCDELAVYDALQGEIRAWGALNPFLLKRGTATAPINGARTATATLAMVPTLARRISDKHTGKADRALWREWLSGVGVVLCDEADKATADGWQSILRATKGSYWRLGFSGSFPEADSFEDWRLEESLGPVIMEARNAEMIERGISARPTVTLVRHDATASLFPLPKGPEWFAMRGPEKRQWAYEAGVLYNAKRHRLVASLVRPDVPTAIVVNRVEHGEILSNFVIGSVFIDGSFSEARRAAALEEFRAGKFSALIVTKILDRGTNRLGFARDVIFASGEGSKRQTLQRIGRGLRRADGKAELRIVDIIDHVNVNPTAQDFPSQLLKAAWGFFSRAGVQRARLYEEEGFTVEVQR